MTGFKDLNIRSYISEPDRGRRNWKDKSEEKQASMPTGDESEATGASNYLTARTLERPFAHTLETGAMRRVHLRHRDNILKRGIAV